MLHILTLFICSSRSYSSQASIFFGEWFSHANLKDDRSFILLELFYYQFQNYKNENILQHINSTNSNANNISMYDDFIFVTGNVTFANSSNTEFLNQKKLVAGVYYKITSEFYMVFNLENYLPVNVIQKINNCSCKLDAPYNSELFNFFNKLISISRNFNYTKQQQLITWQDIKKYKLNNLDDKYISKQKNNYIRNKIILDSLQSFAFKQFNNSNTNLTGKIDFPLIYLKAKNNNKKVLQCDMRYMIEGYIILDKNDHMNSNLLELKSKQIKVFVYLQNYRYFLIIASILTLILMKYYKKAFTEFQYTSKFRYLFMAMYDYLFVVFLSKLFKEIDFFDDTKAIILFLILVFLKYRIYDSNMSNAVNLIKKTTFHGSIKEIFQLVFCIDLFVNFILKLSDNMNDTSNFLIAYLSTSLIPQITFNYFNRHRNLKMSLYMILVTYFRLFEISYYFWFLKGSKKTLIFVFFIVTIQSTILIIQNVFRSVLCIKKTMKKGGFNYFKKAPLSCNECIICLSEIIPEKNDYMITPCNHVFHENCLEKWMVNNNTCPICRGELPVIENFPSFL